MKGWPELFADWSWVRGEGHFPISAYSEFMPPPRIGQKPYGHWEINSPFAANDPFGFIVRAAEQQREIGPGFDIIARQLIESVVALATGRGEHRIGRAHLQDNPYWPQALAERAGSLAHERYVFLSPLALSKSQDDKGRVRWTLFGGSQQGPARGFWKSFFTAPFAERPNGDSLGDIRQLLEVVFDEKRDPAENGFRVLPTGKLAGREDLEDGQLPAWTKPFLMSDTESVDGVNYLLTFRPFSSLPKQIQTAYLDGRLVLLPSPATLVFWGSPHYRRLDTELPLARQILLLQAVSRHSNPRGIRVPQSGWLHDPSHSHDPALGGTKEEFRRTHRWQRMLREEDSAACSHEHRLHKVLFSTEPGDVGLYDKPLARNSQIWSHDFHAVLDGPRANGKMIAEAVAKMDIGDSFGYRFFYPPMQAGRHTVFWHRPLIAFRAPESGETSTVASGIAGYLTAGDASGQENEWIELWPRFAAEEAKESPRDRAAKSAKYFSNYLPPPPELTTAAQETLTFQSTSQRAFEVRYWKTIAKLAEGSYLNKNCADCASDPVTQAQIPWPGRDLDHLADFLLDYYRRLAQESGTAAAVGDMPFRWETDFDFRWMGGWLDSQTGAALDRNIVVVIPGKNRSEAIVMADHYDTAYMEDTYGYRTGKNDGARMAACGADDNHSATAALMLGAEIFMKLSREGKLERDIWLVHLTGEEFPSDCLGARHLAQTLVEGRCRIRTAPEQWTDLSGAKVCGAYVLDMIAHNNDRAKDIFQIAPGPDRQSLWLAYQADMAQRMWNAGAAIWNEKGQRKGLGRGRRSPHGAAIPRIAQHLAPKGEVRLHDDPASTLFNTDGQIFADAGIPTVLFMENYDINREGYHDTKDTMANIDLDYGAAVAAIAIETVARAASEPLFAELPQPGQQVQ